MYTEIKFVLGVFTDIKLYYVRMHTENKRMYCRIVYRIMSDVLTMCLGKDAIRDGNF